MCGVGGSIRAIEKILLNLNLKKNKSDLIDVKVLKQLETELYPNVLNHVNKDIYTKYYMLNPPEYIH